MTRLITLLANSMWTAQNGLFYRAFRRGLVDPRATQESRLLRILRRNGGSSYGLRYDFQSIRNVEHFQNSVPVVTYEDIQPWIQRVMDGEPGVLTEEPVLLMEKTSGSASASKFIPYTRSFLLEFKQAIAPWLYDTYSHRPGLLGTASYWSMSPSGGDPRTAGGLRVGFASDVEYLGRLDRAILEQVLQVPPEVAHISDVRGNLYATVRFLLESPNLGLISVWSPSFLIILTEVLQRCAKDLIRDIALGRLTGPDPVPKRLEQALERRLRPRKRRAQELEEIIAESGSLLPSRVWPRLRLISCWTDGASAQFIPQLQSLFPGVEIQGKGLLATEGVVSIPLAGLPGAAVSVTSHFYEFVDVDRPTLRPKTAEALETGKVYRVVVTTGGGLYRYDLRDLVRVVGWVEKTPLVQFVGKTDNVSDLCGEKLNESWVQAVIETALATYSIEPQFIMVAPEWGSPPYYVLFIEAPGLTEDRILQLVGFIEKGLSQNHHYAYCRGVGQLGQLRGFRVGSNGAADFLAGCTSLGQKLGDIKHSYLHRTPGWCSRMEGRLVKREGMGETPTVDWGVVSG